MSNKIHRLSTHWLVSIALFVILGLFLLNRMGYGFTEVIEQKQAQLKGSTFLQPVKILPDGHKEKIQPGTGVKLAVIVANEGKQSSPAGQLYVRYGYAKPLDKEFGSVIFQTEKKALPIIEPGKQIDLSFDAIHSTPSIPDFVRNDWQLREYQAIAVINQEEHIIGTLALTYSAYYYPGIQKELPVNISTM